MHIETNAYKNTNLSFLPLITPSSASSCSHCNTLLALITAQEPRMRQNMILSGSRFPALHWYTVIQLPGAEGEREAGGKKRNPDRGTRRKLRMRSGDDGSGSPASIILVQVKKRRRKVEQTMPTWGSTRKLQSKGLEGSNLPRLQKWLQVEVRGVTLHIRL